MSELGMIPLTDHQKARLRHGVDEAETRLKSGKSVRCLFDLISERTVPGFLEDLSNQVLHDPDSEYTKGMVLLMNDLLCFSVGTILLSREAEIPAEGQS